MSRGWCAVAGFFFLAVGLVLGWIGVSTLSVLGQSDRDSPTATYLVMGGFFALLAVASLVFAVAQLRRAWRG